MELPVPDKIRGPGKYLECSANRDKPVKVTMWGHPVAVPVYLDNKIYVGQCHENLFIKYIDTEHNTRIMQSTAKVYGVTCTYSSRLGEKCRIASIAAQNQTNLIVISQIISVTLLYS